MNIFNNIKKFASEGRIALSDGNSIMTFAELDARSESLAAYLNDNLKDRNTVVVRGDKQHDMLVCIIAAMKSGRPYTALPDNSPQEKIDMICSACRPGVVFNPAGTDVKTQDRGICIINPGQIDQIVSEYAGASVPESLHTNGNDICAVFFTSGSTGVPKGVQISCHNIDCFLDWWAPVAAPNLPVSGGRALNFASYAFSTAMDSIFFICGYMGMAMYAVDRMMVKDYTRLFEYILTVNPHFLTCTPSFIDLCMEDPRFTCENISGLGVVCVGGERFPYGIARRILERFPDTRIINAYGATETTIGNICALITPEILETNEILPIGYASAESENRVVDEDGNDVPDGVIGELIIVSDMVSQGYLNDPEKNKRNFFTTACGRHGFRTNDLVYKKGNLYYYMGRKDNLVKIGGYRVETEDVEAALRSLPGVKICAVVPVMDGVRAVMLAAYIIPKYKITGRLDEIIKIKAQLASKLQPYMIPQKIIFSDEMPLNSNGKIDRVRLTEISKLK